MSPADVSIVIQRRNTWWERTALGQALVKDVWVPGLATIPLDVALEAMTRYAKAQKTPYPPSLENLVALCDEVEQDRMRAQAQERRAIADREAMIAWHKAEAAVEAQRKLHPVHDPITAVLETAAKDPWAHAHVLMHEKGINRPGREADAMAYCEAMAQDYPDDREAWLRERRLYERDLGRWETPHGMRPQPVQYVPMMTGGEPSNEDGVSLREPGDEAEDEAW
jgi:murein L,D-transpeptidase YcbB/YkuD